MGRTREEIVAYFTTKDSGERQEFPTGAKRDMNNKPYVHYIPPEMLKRLGELYRRGAEKYSDTDASPHDQNWMRGMPLSRYYASMFRHMLDWAEGDTEEDHLAAIIWNATGIMWTETAIREGRLPAYLGDFGPVRLEGEDDDDD